MDGPTCIYNPMKSSYLIQRLEKPHTILGGKAALPLNPFSFGGGFINGGLSKEAAGFLSQIMQFDYMGAAEFEWGAVPQTFKFLAEQAKEKNIVSGELKVDTRGNGSMPVYYICPTPYKEEVIKRITLLAKQHPPREVITKEHVGLNEWTFPRWKTPTRIVGWLEIDNGYMFFVDYDMFCKCREIFI